MLTATPIVPPHGKVKVRLGRYHGIVERRLLFEGSLDELRQRAERTGFAANNLEEVFFFMVDQDNKAKGAKL